ncbi:MAG: hypothetical protein QM820_57955 [Minicystis sp.]
MKIAPAIVLALAPLLLVLSGCETEPAMNKFCKGPDGNVQDCAIACDTTKAADVCKLYATKTQALCAKIGKQRCQKICDADKNEHACAYAKTMK